MNTSTGGLAADRGDTRAGRASREFFELLAKEASAADFDVPVTAAQVRGSSAAEIAELQQDRADALKVRAILRRRARRETELAALFDTAHDLATLRDPEAVLEAIVHRVRRLLATDVAYLSLTDEERGDNYLRVADGLTSARFRQLRAPMGVGLAGLVAQTAVPYSTSDYVGDPQFHHDDGIDAGVRQEGLVAIVAAPLKLGTKVIGVLFAANRTARPFAQEEIDLLSSFAAHAAVAIDNTRLLQETQAALTELGRVNELLQGHSRAVERAAEAHDRMASLVVSGGGIADVAAVLTEVLGGSLAVLEHDTEVVHTAGRTKAIPAEIAGAAEKSRAQGRAVACGKAYAASFSAASGPPVTLVFWPAMPMTGTDKRILERAALMTAMLVLSRHSIAEAESRLRGELLDDLLTRRVEDLAAIHERGRRLGIDLTATHVVIVVRHDGQRERAGFWASAEAAKRHGLATSRSGEIVFLLPGHKPGAMAKRVSEESRTALGGAATVGASGLLASPSQIISGYSEALRCVETLVALGRAGDAASPAELGFIGLLLGQDRDVSGFIDGVIGPVLRYDRRRKTTLAKTLLGYFEAGGNHVRTAELLHIHVNTLTQRLERIAQLIGDDWLRPPKALEVQVALRLETVLRTGP